MKTAIYIENGLTQLVLTPESEFEKRVVTGVEKGKRNALIYLGEFYACQGGWVRQYNPTAEDESLIIVVPVEVK